MAIIVKGGGCKSEEEKTVTAGTSVIEVIPSSGKTMKKVNKPQGKKVKTNLTAIHNFTEWKKFARYAEAKL